MSNQIQTKKTNVLVISGDISQIKADALITAINSEGMWYGGIDGVINKVAGNIFHQQAADKMPLKNEDTVVAKSNNQQHYGAFTNVIFVIDDLKSPLHTIIYKGLMAAHTSGFKTVTLPTIRMGVMLGVVEKTMQEAIDEMVEGVKSFLELVPDELEQITFVVYNDPKVQHMLDNALKKMITI
ncbi:MAG: hypothetical protein AAB657_04855 [Patescibacteria group bacterium]